MGNNLRMILGQYNQHIAVDFDEPEKGFMTLIGVKADGGSVAYTDKSIEAIIDRIRTDAGVYYNRPQEVRALRKLLDMCVAEGFQLYEVYDGEEEVPVEGVDSAIYHTDQVEYATIRMVRELETDNHHIHWFIIWGNNPEEIVADYNDKPWAQDIWNRWQEENF